MSHSLPKLEFVCEMQHKYAVGDKVRVINHKFIEGAEGEIAALIPFTFAHPGYDVVINGSIVAVSERSFKID